MGSVRVQFVLTSEEYEQIREIVEKKGITVSKYVKDRLFGKEEDSFENIWQEFLNKLNSFPANVEFDVSTIMTHSRWGELNKSEKLSIARLFNRKVASGEIGEVDLIGRSPSNVSLYKKR